MEKLKSRKFLLALITAILLVLQDDLGLKIPTKAVITVVAWILSEAAVDVVRAKRL